MAIRILQVSKEFFPLSSGVARHIQGLATAIQSDDATRITILAPLVDAASRDLDVRQGGYLSLWAALADHDLVHVHGARTPFAAFTALLAIVRGRPLVYTPHCYYDTGSKWLRRLKRLWDCTVERLMVRAASAVVLLHKGWETDLAQRGLQPKRVLTIPNCVDDHRQPTITHPVPLEGEPALLSIGRLDPVKRLDDVIAALKTPPLTKAVLHIVGQGVDRSRLETLTAQLDLSSRVRFHGWQDDAVTQQMMAGCKAMVLASEREGMPTVIIEALLAGVPIACSDIEGCRAITDAVGWNGVFALGDIPALGACAAQSAQRTVPATVVEAVRQGFTWQRKAAELVAFYNQAVQRQRPAGWMKRLAVHLTDYDNPHALGTWLRRRRAGPLREMIEQTYARYGYVNVLDVGGTQRYWNILPADYLASRRVSITLLNTRPASQIPQSPFRSVCADGCDLSQFENSAFHIAHSNSVIEHVGNPERVERFASELARVAERYFIQTPDFWCPLEPHCMTPFFHWLPRRLKIWLVRHTALGHWPRAVDHGQAEQLVDSARLLTRRQMQMLFPAARIIRERILGLPKSLIAVSP
ncbi:glycosyltransferase [Pseudomonas vanderleydeniana]|uniref:Glycosyltransferase family 4 protein n=1 Tax=Pseudomonas vanderleydeniana TaxID=2745495 RepID=A0A9E6TPB4_9PSED|nr:glycosyltransferase [Pseudomonas vanderleydeniana]QXI26278.1 glycosyltransferase family 4 protein [Pseudomonas vanderleydeniana]